ncbi:hypothetical protein HLB23_28865 [Nocardia uniformis]|uniref:Uncharacterized protein n=1 Tax=Nocardia uniformis TaxID=53432 RepID=A0A849C7U8_9NOCA|nr:hypothetical protein [Nocardia uniformis]NNH73818.1 hypothetical protein [Nocardia uniformis]
MNTGMRQWPLVAALVLAAGCSTSISGDAMPINADGDLPYARSLTETDRDRLGYYAMIRSLDPCGLLDMAALRDLGALRRFDAENTVNGCRAEIEVDRSDPTRSRLEVELSFVDDWDRTDWTTITVGGQSIGESVQNSPDQALGSNTCRSKIPFDGEYDLLLTVSRRTDEAACPQARTIVAATLPLLSQRPLRESSERKARHAISMHDPCGSFEPLAAAHTITLDRRTTPWSCVFYLDGDDDQAKRTITMSSTAMSRLERSSGGATATSVAGNAAIRSPLATVCEVEVAVGDPPDGNNYDPIAGSKSVTSTIVVRGPDCDSAAELADIAVTTYLHG